MSRRKPGKDSGYSSTVASNKSLLDKNPELTKGAGNLGFYTKLGVPQNFGTITDAYESFSINEPTMLTMYYVPTIGICKSRNDPASIIGEQMATYMRTQISGSRSYDPIDITMHILKISSIIEAINVGWRAYGFARHYDQFDLTTPDKWLRAMGFTPNTITGSMSAVYDDLVRLTLSIARFHITDNITFINRHIELSSTIYVDSDGAKAQKFMFQPMGFYKAKIDGSGVPYLDFEEWISTPGTTKSWSQFVTMLEGMLAQVSLDDDFWTIDGDINKAYSDSIYKLSSLDRDTILTTTVDHGMREQVENATIFAGYKPSSMDITQNVLGGYLEFDPVILAQNEAIQNNRVLNFHRYEVAPLDVCDALQLMNIPSSVQYSAPWYECKFQSVGSEIIVYANMICGDNLSLAITTVVNDTGLTPNSAIKTLCTLEALDWHPTIYVYANDQSGLVCEGVACEFENWRVTTREEVDRAHNAALFSLFGVPADR